MGKRLRQRSIRSISFCQWLSILLVLSIILNLLLWYHNEQNTSITLENWNSINIEKAADSEPKENTRSVSFILDSILLTLKRSRINSVGTIHNKYIMNPRDLIEFIELPSKYVDCINDWDTNWLVKTKIMKSRSCSLPGKISFTVYNKIGFGETAITYNVSISNDFYALKFLYHKKRCYPINKEFTILKIIEQYLKHLSIESSSLNLPYIHPSIPGYWIINEKNQQYKKCFVFYEQVPNAKSWYEFLIESKMFQATIIEKYESIFSFLLRCYHQLMNISRILYDIGVFHNDMTEGNVLIDIKTFKCYLIDYGQLFHKTKLLKSWTFKCLPHSCSPIGFYYLKSVKERQKLQSIVNNNATGKDVLSEYALYEKQYGIATFIFHAFVKLYSHQNSRLFKMNEKIISMGSNEASVGENETNYVYHWCKRYEMIQILKHIDTNPINEPIVNELWDVFSIFENDVYFLNKTNCISIN